MRNIPGLMMHTWSPCILFLLVAAGGCGADAGAGAIPPQDAVRFDNYAERIEAAGGEVQISLNLAGKSSFSDEDLASLHLADSVTSIDLSGTRVTDAGIASLKRAKNLQKLDLSGTQVTDAAIDHLKELPQLKSVVLHHCKVSRKAQLEMMKILSARQSKQ